MCYNGPSFTLGEDDNVTKCKSDYANAIKILNDESIPYGEGTYGYSTRHLGSDPANPSNNETIDESNMNAVETHYESDLLAVQSFSGEEKLMKQETEAGPIVGFLTTRDYYLAARSNDYNAYYNVYTISSEGTLSTEQIYAGMEVVASSPNCLAPVVSLESGVKIIEGSGNGSEESPWTLTK